MTLAAGKYYVGDPCYVLNETQYDEFLNLVHCGRPGGMIEGEFNFASGQRFAIYNTYHGDGQYDGSNGFKYPVDAGCLSVIPVEACDGKKLEESLADELGHIEDFGKTFETKGESDGTIVFGHIRIDTNPAFDDDEDED